MTDSRSRGSIIATRSLKGAARSAWNLRYWSGSQGMSDCIVAMIEPERRGDMRAAMTRVDSATLLGDAQPEVRDMQVIAGYEDRTVRARGIEFHYLEWGETSAPPMVLLHGLTGHAHTW